MFSEKISISVVIPVYNREKTIYRCLKSVLEQTYAVEEIIVVDDGSVDNTKKIITNFSSDKICLLCQKHKGAQAARNKGIINAKGNYIAFLDSDDEWVLDKLEKQVDILKKNLDAVIYCNCFTVDKGIKRVWKLPGKSGWVYKELLLHPSPMFQGMIISKKALLDIGLLDENIPAYQEWDTSIRLAENHMLVHMDEPLFYYNFHEGDTISKNNIKDILGYEYVVNKHKKEIIRECGYLGLQEHYELLIKKSVEYKSFYLYKYIWKWYQINFMVKIKGDKK
jgi:glycosyltransferase involved in cell wall biosynthesis